MGQCMLLHIPTRMYSISSEGSMTSYRGTQHANIVAVKKMDACSNIEEKHRVQNVWYIKSVACTNMHKCI